LRDFKTDMQLLERSYFPNIDVQKINHHTKKEIIDEIERDFRLAYRGIVKLPNTSRFGVYSAYKYYKQLLRKIERTEPHQIMETRIRVSDHIKLGLLAKSYFDIKLNLV
ncbi:MAG TPA: phytoene synthase, partial [Flavobacteriales bacterium]|nr:phytoene synthase [Flavobacteriales bacterium]